MRLVKVILTRAKQITFPTQERSEVLYFGRAHNLWHERSEALPLARGGLYWISLNYLFSMKTFVLFLTADLSTNLFIWSVLAAREQTSWDNVCFIVLSLAKHVQDTLHMSCEGRACYYRTAWEIPQTIW